MKVFLISILVLLWVSWKSYDLNTRATEFCEGVQVGWTVEELRPFVTEARPDGMVMRASEVVPAKYSDYRPDEIQAGTGDLRLLFSRSSPIRFVCRIRIENSKVVSKNME